MSTFKQRTEEYIWTDSLDFLRLLLAQMQIKLVIRDTINVWSNNNINCLDKWLMDFLLATNGSWFSNLLHIILYNFSWYMLIKSTYKLMWSGWKTPFTNRVCKFMNHAWNKMTNNQNCKGCATWTVQRFSSYQLFGSLLTIEQSPYLFVWIWLT